MGLGDVGAGGGAGVAGHGRSVLCRFLSCDLGHLLGGCEGPKGSGSEGLRHGWGWGGARGELQIPLEEPLPTWAPASLGLAPRVQAAGRSVLRPQSQRPRPLPRRSLSYRKQLERGRPESHSEMRLVVPGPVLASRPKRPDGHFDLVPRLCPAPRPEGCALVSARALCAHACVRARSVSVVCGRMGQSQMRAGGFLALLSWAGPALQPRGRGPGQPPPAVTPTCASRCGRVQHEQRQLRPGLRQHQGQLRMRLPPGEAAALEPEGLRG